MGDDTPKCLNHLGEQFRAERVGQRLNQDAWDQVRQLIKNL
jgi:hypothetical protein